MNVFERTALKLGWRRMEGKMPEKFKRYVPLVGSALLVTVVLLRFFGYDQAAGAVESVGGIVGVTQQSPVGMSELVAAVATMAGIGLKVQSEIQKARGTK